MKNIKNYILFIGIMSLLTSCVDDLLNRNPTTQVSSEAYWRNTDDVLYITMGNYSSARSLFGRDHYFDGFGEFQYTRGTSAGDGSFNSLSGFGSSFSFIWNRAYTVIDKSNFINENIDLMLEAETLETNKRALERMKGENCFLRALAYFRLISFWGDVPYFETSILNQEAITLSRTPIGEIKDGIIKDLTYAISVLPEKITANSERGRATQVAAYAFRAKVALYWACWKKNGWDELDEFTKDANEANKYYQDAANDFKKVIDGYGLKLFSEGNPGTADSPTYWELFNGTDTEYDPEIIFSICFGGPNLSGQGEELLRDYGTRATGNAQCWVSPTNRLVNRYQSLTTGDFVAPVILNASATLEGGACNPDTYLNRDYRMKATLLWDYETMLGISTDGMTLGARVVFKFGTTSGSYNGMTYINYDAPGIGGYIYRKWVRQYGGIERSQGKQDYYMMRLADVYLMYCEAVNEVSGPSQELVTLINKIRSRGNLPGLAPEKYANKEEFFKAIEQERIVELAAEGHRYLDIKRWRKLEEIWGTPGGPGQILYNTSGVQCRTELRNASVRDFQRYYIFQIPTGERNRNPNLTQNRPWL